MSSESESGRVNPLTITIRPHGSGHGFGMLLEFSDDRVTDELRSFVSSEEFHQILLDGLSAMGFFSGGVVQ